MGGVCPALGLIPPTLEECEGVTAYLVPGLQKLLIL